MGMAATLALAAALIGWIAFAAWERNIKPRMTTAAKDGPA